MSREVIQALYKFLALYHLSPSLIWSEINPKEARKLIDSIESRLKPLPAWCNSELPASILPVETTLSLIRRAWQRMILKLEQNPNLKSEIDQWSWNRVDEARYTSCMLWRHGFELDVENIMKLFYSKHLRLVLQIKKNCFFDKDNQDEVLIWKWGLVWDKVQRVFWDQATIKHLRLFSLESHYRYLSKGNLDIDKYIKDLEIASSEINQMILIKREEITNEMIDKTIPKTIDLATTAKWIKEKFELVALITYRQIPKEGEEYKFYEDLLVNMDLNFYIPAKTNYDLSTRWKPMNSNGLIREWYSISSYFPRT